MKMINKINKPNNIKNLSEDEIKELIKELREVIIKTTSINGGHLASSLGTIELTIGILLSLDLEKDDKIIWDVGHQAYAYKILTGRSDDFSTLRQFRGISGFPRRSESQYDYFGAGHSSTSISAGLGFCVARELNKKKSTIVSVIGDGSLTGGEAFEALNNASKLISNFIIVLNDNDMSIAKNEGGLHMALEGVRTSYNYIKLKEKVKDFLEKIPYVGDVLINFIILIKNILKQIHSPRGMIFENMNIAYIGPIDGHNVEKVKKAIDRAKEIKKAVVVHIKTKKGNGYEYAETDPIKFHGIAPFEIETGEIINKKKLPTYTNIFAKKIVELAKQNDKIVAMTAAMPDGTGLNLFKKEFPNRYFDTGIAEQHTITFASSLAIEGFIPFVCIYSTFLQRAYDQILEDVCLQKLHVIFCIDRAGLVGQDGETHQGIFDISFLSHIPNMTIMAPKGQKELEQMMDFATKMNSPVAIRYPRGIAFNELDDLDEEIKYGKAEIIYEGNNIALLALGRAMSTALHVYEKLKLKNINASLINARFASPIDTEMINKLCQTHNTIVTLEENVKRGGFGEAIAEYIMEKGYEIRLINESLPNEFVPHGSVDVLRENLKVDSDSILKDILE
ncbi:MAG: 1-deoxy-D-xylulose-5-phosphate synthase [Eubacteriales bacterium]|nr:1-deoxy-D-xylulose-5-phosphate synthase [Eubacteriales bacterium]